MSMNGNKGGESTPIPDMRMVGHLSDSEIDGFRRSSLDPARLLVAGEHITECSICRSRILPDNILSAKLDHLQQEFMRHLTDEELAAWVDAGPVDDPHFVEAHLERCSSCRQELADLHGFQQKLKPARRSLNRSATWGVLAAAAVLIIAVVAQRKPAAAPDAARTTPVDMRRPEVAILPREVERAPILDQLFRPEGKLLGDDAQHAYHALSPVGIVTMSDRPQFRWEAIPGASDYVVGVYDKDFEKLVESPKIDSARWIPADPLPRGIRLSWQVTATVNGKPVRLPVPPAREAVFEVMSAETAKTINEARDLQHASPVELGLLYARAGALEDAEAEFAGTPDAKDLLESVRKLLRQTQNPVPTITKPAQ